MPQKEIETEETANPQILGPDFVQADKHGLEPITAQQEILKRLAHIREKIYQSYGMYEGDLIAEVREERDQHLNASLGLEVT